MLKMTRVFMPEARKPVICAAVKPLALPMPPLQKSIAVVAAAGDGPANNSSKPSVMLANHNILRGITIYCWAERLKTGKCLFIPPVEAGENR
jgi:hypothetical protein